MLHKRTLKTTFIVFAVAVFFGLVFTACGGEGGGSTANNDQPIRVTGQIAGRDAETIISKTNDFNRAVITPIEGKYYIVRFISSGELISIGTVTYSGNTFTFTPNSGYGSPFTGTYNGPNNITIIGIVYNGQSYTMNNNGSDSNPGGTNPGATNPGQTSDVAAFRAWLDAQPANTVSDFYRYDKLKNIDNFSELSQALFDNSSFGGGSDKYVFLDLSGCALSEIPYGAFTTCKTLVGIILPNGVTSIGESAFQSCINLTGITIPDGVTSIGKYAFWGCYNITDVSIPKSVISIGHTAFASCSGLTSVTIPATSIGEGAFVYCRGLITVTIENNVTSIGKSAFGACSSLTNVTIPASVNRIEMSAFGECTNLISVTFQGTIPSSGFIYPFDGDLRDKFYATDEKNGTPGTYTTEAPVNSRSEWTRR